MTIHDELILELVKPDKSGKPTGDIIKITGTGKIRVKLEESTSSYQYLDEKITVTPDIVVDFEKTSKFQIRRVGQNDLAIELENDIQWDFADSLQQVKKYDELFDKVVVIIPREYERFAPLYKNEGFRVWFWKATRVWECMQCGTITEERRTVKPRCSGKNCNSTEQRLKDVKDTQFEEFA